jgi:glutathione S-transferase
MQTGAASAFTPGLERKLAYSPAGKVPILIDGDMHIWESLAIMHAASPASCPPRFMHCG